MISIVIVNYNSTQHTLNCLESIKQRLNGMAAEIFVQDNASADDVERIQTAFPHVVLTRNRSNIGFARAVNQALERIQNEYVVLLNPDTIVNGDFFQQSLDFMEQNPRVGILGPKVLDSDGRLQNSARSFPTPLTAFFGRSSFISRWFPKNPITSRNLLSLQSDGKTPMPVDWVSGACMVVRRRALMQVGSLDERFFMYWEDADWCRRMWEARWQVIYYPRVSVHHFVGGSSGTSPIRSRLEFHKSVFRLFNKYNGHILTLISPLAIGALCVRFLLLAYPYLIRRWIFAKADTAAGGVRIQPAARSGRLSLSTPSEKRSKDPAEASKTPRVLQMITRMIVGGAQEHVMLTSEMLRRQGWEVDILTGAQIGPEGSLINDVRRRNLPMFIEPFLVREIQPLKDVIAFFRIVRFIRKRRYDIVHTNSSKAGIQGRWAARVAGVPVIVHTVHGWGFHDRQNALERNLYVRMERFTRRFTHAYVAVTVRDIDKGVKNGIGHPADYVVIRSGIELSRFRNPVVPRDIVRRRLGIPESAKVVGTVTRLSPQKAPLVFARAILTAAGRMPDAYFVIVGDGPLRPKVEAVFASTDVAHRVILTGIRDDVPDLMAAFDVFVLSSLWEGLPRVIPQAMINGLPVIVSAIDGNVEIIRDFKNGRLVPPGDVPALAEAMVHMMKHPDIARALGDAGRGEAARFDASAMGNQTAHLYRRLLHEKKAEGRYLSRFSPVTLDN